MGERKEGQLGLGVQGQPELWNLVFKNKSGGAHSWDTKVRCDFKIKEKEAGDCQQREDTCRQTAATGGRVDSVPSGLRGRDN